MRSLHALVLIVHLRIDVVPAVWIGVRVVVLLVAIQTVVRRLPAYCVANVRAVVAATGLLLAVSGRRLEDLWWSVVAVGRVRGK